MALAAGTRLGPYEILEPLGAGGMGEVYRARDPSLERDVAIKLLHEHAIVGPEGLARFEREAKLLAALNHPGIASIHAIQQHNGQPTLILELVEGQTLEERLKRGALPAAEALEVSRQIAEALEAAHDRGIIHRDLKPSNIKLSPEGRIKLLDFGLGKALRAKESASSSVTTAEPPEGGTRAGMVMGTEPYMSPEQARGEEVDRRTDIWAFGCVVYELLVGQRAFPGRTRSDAIAAVLEREPDMEALPAATPPFVRSLLRRCLRKKREQRLHDIADARIEIEEVLSEPDVFSTGTAPLRATRPDHRGVVWGWAGGVVLGALLAGSLVWVATTDETPARPARLRMDLQPAQHYGGAQWSRRFRGPAHRSSWTELALSPDGRQVVFGGSRDGTHQLYLRRLDQDEALPIPGTEGGTGPFFSPDGGWLGFWAEGTLKKVALTGGLPVTLCSNLRYVFGASWASDDTIVFSQDNQGGLWQVSAGGGVPQELTRPEAHEVSHRLPHVLPGGEALLFTRMTRPLSWSDAEIVVQVLATGERRVVIEGGVDARYAHTGHLLYVREGTLMAVGFDLTQLEVTSTAVPVVDDVMHAIGSWSDILDTGAAQFSVSTQGSLVYVSGGVLSAQESSLVWVDRAGVAEPVAAPPAQPYFLVRLSPDGQRIAAAVNRLNDQNIWIVDTLRGTMSPLTLTGCAILPLWTHDGTRVMYSSSTGGSMNLFSITADGSRVGERLTVSEHDQYPASWSPSSEELAFVEYAPATNGDIWVLRLGEGNPEARPVVQTPAEELQPAFSPDGQWLAFASDESGRYEVYVQPYPGPGAKTRVSVEGGRAPAWAQSGRMLFFRGLPDERFNREMLAVEITTAPVLAAGMPEVLFEGRYRDANPTRGWDVTTDGGRFLMVQPGEWITEPATHINIVLNFDEELKRLVPTD